MDILHVIKLRANID